MAHFPPLQGLDSKGKTRAWSIHVVERDGCGVILTSYGLAGGKMISHQRDVCVGKNLGKKNETTPLQQAVLEARAAWIKTKESGYHEVSGAAHATQSVHASPSALSAPSAPLVLSAPQVVPLKKRPVLKTDSCQVRYEKDVHKAHTTYDEALHAAEEKYHARSEEAYLKQEAALQAAKAKQAACLSSKPLANPFYGMSNAAANAVRVNMSNGVSASNNGVNVAANVANNGVRVNMGNGISAAASVAASVVNAVAANAARKPLLESVMNEEQKEIPMGRGKGINETVPLPMLAHDYNKRGKGAIFPCYIQPKLDGTRCIGIPHKGLFSRTRKSFPHMEHIVAELNRLPKEVILDGELYTHDLTFQEIVGLVKKEKLKEGNQERQEKIKYHVYDMVSAGTFEERFAVLEALMRRYRFQHIVLVLTEKCSSEAEMKIKHQEYVAAGYEGVMLRNPAGLYKSARSMDLLKYKEFMDEEYTVVGYTEGEGLEKGCVLWICETPEGKRFTCRPRGTHEERKVWFKNGAAYVGKKLTVRFQELSDGGVPRFPVGIAFRDYE